MKKLLAALLVVAQLATNINAAAPEPRRIPERPTVTITTSHRPGEQPLAAIIKWKRSTHPFDFDCLEFSSQPSGGVWEVLPGPYFVVDDSFVVPILLNDSPRNRRFYRVYRMNAL